MDRNRPKWCRRAQAEQVSQRHRIERRMRFDVVIEIHVHIAAGRQALDGRSQLGRVACVAPIVPCPDSLRPKRERFPGVPAGIELLVPMQSHIDEIRRHLANQRPLPCRIRHDKTDLVLAKQRDELSTFK